MSVAFTDVGVASEVRGTRTPGPHARSAEDWWVLVAAGSPWRSAWGSGRSARRGPWDKLTGSGWRGHSGLDGDRRSSSRNRTGAVRARKAEASEIIVRHMATEICQDSARMNREGTNSTRRAAPIELHSQQHICGFRLAVGLPLVIGAMLKLSVVKINSCALVTA